MLCACADAGLRAYQADTGVHCENMLKFTNVPRGAFGIVLFAFPGQSPGLRKRAYPLYIPVGGQGADPVSTAADPYQQHLPALQMPE